MKAISLLLVLLTLVNYGQSQILATMGDEVHVVEGGAGTGNLITFPVYLSEPVLTQSTVTFSVVAGTATSGVDYLVPLTTTITFLPGSSQEVIRVPIFGDSTVEDTETFDVLLTSGTGVTVSFPFASRGYIVNDDGVGATLTAETSVREAFSIMTFTVTLATTSTMDSTFSYRAYSKSTDTATPGEDYDNDVSTLTIPAGSLSVSGFINIIDDITPELNETFTIEVYNPNRFWFANSTNGATDSLSSSFTIIDDDIVLTVSDASVLEGSGTNSNFVFTVSLTNALTTGQSAIVSLYLVHITSSADDFSDTTAVNSNLTFVAGEQSKTVTIVVLGDTVAEPTETFELQAEVVDAVPIAMVQSGFRSVGTGTIVNDDALITLTFSRTVTTSTVAETVGNLVFTVTPSGTNTGGPAGSYQVSVNSITAINTLDFTTTLTSNDLLSAKQTISWAAGVTPTPFTFTVTVLTDLVAENDETFNVTLTDLNSASAPGVTSWVHTITDTTVVLAVANATTVAEGNGGATTANTLLFPITLNRVSSSALSLTIEYNNVSDTMIAQSGVDYTGPTTLNIAAGVTSTFLTVTIIGDSVVELDEWVIFAITGVVPTVVVSNNVGQGMISNDDTYVYVGDVTVAEGDVGVTSAVVRIHSPTPFPASSTVTYFTPNSVGTAVAGTDYTAAQSTITLPTGLTETFVTISILADTIAEATETFTVEITSGTGGIGPGSPAFGTVTIVNDDGPSLSIVDVDALESTGQLVFTFVLDAVPETGASVSVSTGNLLSATPIVDFTVVRNETVSFTAGSTNATFTVIVIDDAVAETTETLTLTFATPNFIRVPSALLPTGRIVNDDGIRVGFLNTAEYSLPETDSGIKNFLFVIGPVGSSTGLNSAAEIRLETIAGTATAASDYVPLTAQTISIGTSPVTVTVQVIGDTIAEPTETFQVRLYYPNYVFFSSPTTIDLSVTASILGDDYFANITSVTTKEGDIGDASTQFVFEILFTGAASLGSTLTYATSDVTALSTASSNNDYIAIPSTTVNIATGATNHLVTVTVIPDNTPEGNETFSLTLTGSYLLKLGTPTVGTGTIINDDYTLSVVDQSIFEGDTTSTVTFTFTIDGPAQEGATFRVQTTDGTALAGINYVAIDNVMNLTTGVETVSISVNIIGDTLPGPSVSFNLVFSQVSRIILSSTTAKVTIINDDGPQISVLPVSVLEGNTTAQSLVFVVSSDAAVSTAAAGFYIQTRKVTTSVGDFNEVSSPLFVNFTSGETSKSVTINTIPDTTIEDTETFELVITNPAFVKFSSGTTASGLTAVGTIINDDGLGVTVPALFRVEGTSSNSTTPFVFSVNLVGGTARNGTSIGFTILPGTATSPDDYSTTSGTVSFTTGATFGTATVQVIADSMDEPQETFFLTLHTPNQVNIDGFTNATATISNDDAVVTISPASVLEGTTGTTSSMVFNVSLSSAAPPSPGQVTFAYTVTGLTATAGTDFVAVTSTFTFAAGTTAGTITVMVNGDNTAESDEIVQLSITSITNGIIGTSLVNGTILNDDMQLNVVNEFFYERDTTYAYRFPIYQTVPSSSPATVTYSITSFTAVAGRDFQLLSNLTLSLNDTDVITYIDFDVLGDLVPQGDKFFQVSLTGCVGCVIGGSPSATVTLWEDDYSIAFSSPTYTVTETESTFNMTVTLTASQPLVTSGPNPQITVSTSDATAVAGSDYSSRTSTFTFQSGDSSATLTIPILGDTVSEPTESFLVSLSNPIGLKIGAPGSATVTILDNDARLIRVSHPRMAEGGDARAFEHDMNLRNLTFVVSLSGPATAGSSINYTTVDGTADENVDYLPVSGTYDFVAGETSFSVNVPIIADFDQESSETVNFQIISFIGSLKTDEFSDGVGTIVNDDYKAFGIHGVVRGELRINNRQEL